MQIDHATGERVTYGSLVAIIKKLAFGLHKQGIGQGDVVCFFAEKSILGVAVIFSLAKLGAIMTPCRPSHTASEEVSFAEQRTLVLAGHFVLCGPVCIRLDAKGFFCRRIENSACKFRKQAADLRQTSGGESDRGSEGDAWGPGRFRCSICV